MTFSYDEFDVSDVRTYPLSSRVSKAAVSDFARPCDPDTGVGGLVASLPNMLAAANFRAVVAAIVAARRGQRGLLWGLGAHVVKTGLGPVMIDLMERGFVSAIATNGAAVIHDFEVALGGATSEDVDESLGPGRFGMAEETGRVLNEAIATGVAEGLGLGQAVCRFLTASRPAFAHASVMAAAARLNVPVTVHVAIGTDIIHQHPEFDGGVTGEMTARDFRLLTSVVADLGDGGVWLNVGSAVLLPEVFLKALSIAQNLGHHVDGFTTANFDMIQHYRPLQNVVKRPTSGSGRGYTITGHHEINIPLLAAAVLERLGHSSSSGRV